MLAALRYRIVSAMFHQPRLLRAAAGALRRHAALSSALGVAAGINAVRAMLSQETRFSHGHYPAVMPGGPFLIGLPSGPVHAAKRQCLQGLLPRRELLVAASARALDALVGELRARTGVRDPLRFDLVDDYMVPLVWNALRLTYDERAEPVTEVDRELVQAARWLGAQLLIGAAATPAVQQRALRSARQLSIAFDDAMSGAPSDFGFDARWLRAVPARTERLRDAIGLMWVGHPSVTQAGVLMMQELLARPEEYARLIEATARVGGTAADMPPHHRELLRAHVLELLRFRPPFPLLGRLVAQPTQLPSGASGQSGPADGAVAEAIHVKAGACIAMTLGALFDPAAQHEDPRRYVPGRHFHHEEDRLLMFGTGPRRCIAGDQVVEVLVTALHGLLCLGLVPAASGASASKAPLRQARRCSFDGPIIVHMPMTTAR
jgi:cytochrome P450